MKRACFLFLLLALLAGCQTAEPASGEPSAASTEPLAAPAQPDPPPPGSGWDSRPRPIVTIPAPEESFFLTRWDGETLLEQFCCSKEDLEALSLSQVQGYAVGETWDVPEDPWPIYGLRVSGPEKDYEAAFCGGTWLDSEGYLLQEADVDFPALWERFARSPQPRTGPQPAVRELALCSGQWDSRFLREAEEAASLVPMTLTVSGGGIGWTIENRTAQTIETGNGSTAVLQVLLDGVWYGVPTLSGAHYAWTAEACSTPPGETFSGVFWQAPYGPLPSGDYRLALRWTAPDGQTGWSASPFQVRGGAFAPAAES